MKRDLNLVRDILIFFEERNSSSIVEFEEIAAATGQSDVRIVAYHVRLMWQANFLTCELIKSSTSDRVINALPFELTWDGHEFLRLSREKAWEAVKQRLGDGFFDTSFDVLKALLIEYAKRQLGLGVGA